jgi:hypothetical protein
MEMVNLSTFYYYYQASKSIFKKYKKYKDIQGLALGTHVHRSLGARNQKYTA